MNSQFAIWKMIKNRWWVILLTVMVITGLTGFYSLYLNQPVYEASTRVIVGTSNSDDSKALDASRLVANIQLIETYKEIISSSRILDAVVKTHPELGMNTEELLNSVVVSSVINTQVMMISAWNESFDTAVRISNAVTDEFLKQIPSIMKIDNFTVLDRAGDSPAIPISTDPVLMILLGFVLSIFAAAGITVILEFSDDTFKSEEDIFGSLGIPNLATIHITAKRYVINTRVTKRKVADSTYAG